MSYTVRSHLEDCKRVSDVVDNANALVIKAKRQLEEARDVLELLRENQHPKLQISVGYRSWADEKHMTGTEIADIEIGRINALLGDRA